ncbi:MAG: hypothetical protein M3Q65_09605 [Chloroflexota bacterium]|nr:hypothetical protein [Chloroflexota bacterium]
MATHREPLPLYLVTHRGPLAVNDNEPVASRRIVDREAGPLLETLVEATWHQAESIARIVNVLTIHPAPAGRFVDDDGGAVVIAPDGAWHREEAPAGGDETR